ncbi:MAG: hypothetical protein R3236_08980, partial [Phycisphaeraceae bacterium]|nr:hypothetical protein [Phycisphaeraceae bacterium]
GGGSVEVTMAVRGRAMGFESLPTGPVRLLGQLQRANLTETDTGQLIEPYQQMVQTLCRAELGQEPPQVAFGAGGNIKRLAKLRQALLGRTHDDRLKVSNLDALIEKLTAMDCNRRVKELGLRADRADLIVIAAIVLRSIMLEAGVEKIMVPGIGLLDGLLREVARGGGRAWGRLTQR